MDSYNILTGVGRLYIAPVGTAFPTLSSTPASPWRDLGETQDGVTVTPSDSVQVIRADQRTGGVAAVRDEEDIMLETKLMIATLENLADVLGNTVTDTPPGTGTIGTRSVRLHRGATVATHALLFRGTSPYGAYPAQYELPVGYFAGDIGLEHVKDNNVVIPAQFVGLEDLNAVSDGLEFGQLIAQDAAAT